MELKLAFSKYTKKKSYKTKRQKKPNHNQHKNNVLTPNRPLIIIRSPSPTTIKQKQQKTLQIN